MYSINLFDHSPLSISRLVMSISLLDVVSINLFDHCPLSISMLVMSISLFYMCAHQSALLTMSISLLAVVSISLFDQSYVDQPACHVDQPVLHACTSISLFDHVDRPVGCCVDQPACHVDQPVLQCVHVNQPV